MSKFKGSTPIKECPHCHSNMGVYTKSDLINVPHRYNFDGSDDYNGEMYDNAEKTIWKPTVYCQNCDKRICSWYEFCRRNDILPF